MNDTTAPENTAGQVNPADSAFGRDNGPAGFAMHMGLAEQGKMHALEGRFELALVYYREAMRLATNQGAPELFFRHYLECMLEALEQAGAFREVLAYCDRAIEHHKTIRANDDDHARFLQLDRAYIHQRRGVVLLKLGQEEAAREALSTAIAEARRGNLELPLAESVYGWLMRRYRIDVRRLQAEQEAHRYYSVRPDTVEPAKAIQLPPEHIRALKVL